MINYNLKKGDKVAIVSLSSGIMGEKYVRHELEIGVKRLQEFGLVPVFMNNSLKGIEYIKNHPEKRADDLKNAFMDKDIKMIITAIGGDDTYKTISYLMEDKEFIKCVKDDPKIFSGFSDTTINHFMLNKLGLSTFYGPAFLVDVAELEDDMLSYTKEYFLKYFDNKEIIEIKSSPIWYEDRSNYNEFQVGVKRVSHPETHGFEVLNGGGVVSGKLFGGCIDSIYDAFVGERYGDENIIFEKYELLPTLEEWSEKILFLETSEEMLTPEKLKKILLEFKKRGILDVVKGLIIGKPMNEKYYEEYKNVYREVFKDSNVPVMYNVNFGHSVPRCFLQYNSITTVDYDNKKIIMKLVNLSEVN